MLQNFLHVMHLVFLLLVSQALVAIIKAYFHRRTTEPLGNACIHILKVKSNLSFPLLISSSICSPLEVQIIDLVV